MAELTAKERKALLNTAKKIRTYKLMQSDGYHRLIKKATDDRTKQLLAEISANELSDAESWSQKINQLADGNRKSGRVSFSNQKVGLMMGVLGTRGFFEWSIIAEDESVEELAIQAGNMSNVATSEEWTRMASDERLHIERMKKEVLGMEGWEMGSGGGVRDVIFGANDGLVSILALVAGVYGAIAESYPILIAGIAGALLSIIFEITPQMGLPYTIIAIIAVVLGGLGNILASLIGGLILGLVGNIVMYVHPGLSLIAFYFIFLLILLVKPTGILGKRSNA